MEQGCKPKTLKQQQQKLGHAFTSNFHQAFQPPQFPIIPDLDLKKCVYALKTTHLFNPEKVLRTEIQNHRCKKPFPGPVN